MNEVESEEEISSDKER